jgi:glutamyl-tRNA reductase
MTDSGQMNPQGRQAALALGAGRLGLGVAALFFTRPALKALLFGRTDAVGESLARLAGARDLTLGAMTLAAHDDAARLRALTLTAAALDTADAVAFGLAARTPALRLAGLGGVVAGGGAAVAGAWAWRRLGA